MKESWLEQWNITIKKAKDMWAKYGRHNPLLILYKETGEKIIQTHMVGVLGPTAVGPAKKIIYKVKPDFIVFINEFGLVDCDDMDFIDKYLKAGGSSKKIYNVSIPYLIIQIQSPEEDFLWDGKIKNKTIIDEKCTKSELKKAIINWFDYKPKPNPKMN